VKTLQVAFSNKKKDSETVQLYVASKCTFARKHEEREGKHVSTIFIIWHIEKPGWFPS
jgi:hypothetical protein